MPAALQMSVDIRSVMTWLPRDGEFVDENRIIDIETRLAYQEHLLAQLNDAVANQQAQVTELERLYRSLLDKMISISDALPGGQVTDERPPHY